MASTVSGLPVEPNRSAYSALRSLIPWTLPSQVPVARKLSRCGMVIENFSSVPSSDPTVKMLNGAAPSVVS